MFDTLLQSLNRMLGPASEPGDRSRHDGPPRPIEVLDGPSTLGLNSRWLRYRILFDDRVVRYLVIHFTIWHELAGPYGTLCEALPPFPHGDWSLGTVTVDAEGFTQYKLSERERLPVMEEWHSKCVSILSLKKQKSRWRPKHKDEVIFEGQPAVIEYVEWPWPTSEPENLSGKADKLRRACVAYELIEASQCPRMAPRFLAHVTENAIITGFVRESVEGVCAEPSDLARCEAVVKSFHALGLILGRLEASDFVVESKTSQILIKCLGDVSFQSDLGQEAFEEAAKNELRMLRRNLSGFPRLSRSDARWLRSDLGHRMPKQLASEDGGHSHEVTASGTTVTAIDKQG